MTPEERRSINNEIKGRITQTEKTIESLREKIKPIPLDGTIGRVTRMDAIGHRSIAEAQLREAKESLSLLKYALLHLDEESFGVCGKCKRKIPLERILAIPEVRLCVTCASVRY
ncbi:MAG: TraR/DksA C4-type zinc finger protein [Candidatus Omnitrophica bacterium]|nr:TraR/DksA C4-type zinc finger protein [Candidatus Omnitrophota bacterium]